MNTRTLLGALVFITAPVCLQATTSSVPLNYEYDANGNLISGDGKYYEYNDANRLVKIRHYDKTGPVIVEYFYDYTGQRVKKIEDGITTYYIGKHFEAQPDGDKLVNTSYYFANGERVAKKDSAGQLSYYHTNHLGSTSVMTDKDGKLVENTRYYPFGEIREGGKEKYSFTGKERDRISESYYFEARYYGSEFKHFTQADTVIPDVYEPQSLNRYSYVVNNPTAYIDPTGHEYKWWKYTDQKSKFKYISQPNKGYSNEFCRVRSRLSLKEKQEKQQYWLQQKAKSDAEAAYYSTYADELRIPIGVAKITLGVTAGAEVIVGGAVIATGVTTVGSVGSAISLAVGHPAGVVSSITSIMSGVMEISGASPIKINSVDTITNYAGWAKLGASMVGLPGGDFVSKLDFVSSAVNVIINQF